MLAFVDGRENVKYEAIVSWTLPEIPYESFVWINLVCVNILIVTFDTDAQLILNFNDRGWLDAWA